MEKKFYLPLLTLLLILPFTIIITSCSDDDDDKNSDSTGSIVGSWYSYDDYMDITLRFDKDGDFYGYASEGNAECDFYGEYQVKGNKLIIHDCYSSSSDGFYPPFERGETYKISISKDELSLTYLEDGEEDDEPYNFIRMSDSDFEEDDDDWK